MTLYEFNVLDLNNRMEAVNQYGKYLDNHISQTERCNLYSIDKFFVEVVYDSKSNSIVKINSFITGYLLDKYSNLKF